MPSNQTVKLRIILLFVLVALMMNGMFILLQRYANSAPPGLVKAQLASAYQSQYTFSRHNYPFVTYGHFSLLSMMGQNLYTECELALGALANPGHRIKDAVLPKTLNLKPSSGIPQSKMCQKLEQIVTSTDPDQILVDQLRPRYLWGGVAIMGSLLRHLNYFQVKELISIGTYTSLLLLAIGIGLTGRGPLIVLAPLLVMTGLFTGITYYKDVAIGIPYLWSLLGPALYALLHAARAPRMVLSLALFVIGCVSCFVWLLDGHLLQMITWIGLIALFTVDRGLYIPKLKTVLAPVQATLIYFTGFLATYFINQCLKIYYIGFDTAWRSIRRAVEHRVSDSTGQRPDIEYGELVDRLWHFGFEVIDSIQVPGASDLVLNSALAALILAIVLIMVSWYRYRTLSILGPQLVVLGLIGHFFLRFALTPNHAWIHPYFVGRYLYIVPGLAFVLLLIGCMQLYAPRSSGTNVASHSR